MMLFNTAYPFIVALTASLSSWIFGLNYWWSNFLVFGMFLILIGIRIEWRSVAFPHGKGILAFFAFSTVVTTLLELLFLKTDTWGFSRTFTDMIGINLLGYPLEEYVFWEFCPLAVIFTYLYMVGLRPKTLKISSRPTVSLARTSASPEYQVDDIVRTDAGGYPSYVRGARIPVYSMFVTFVLASIWAMRSSFAGRVKEILVTTAVFFLLIAPYEQYALLNQVWLYNLNKMSGLVFLGVPLEEWLVYFACPAAGCLFIRKFTGHFDKDAL